MKEGPRMKPQKIITIVIGALLAIAGIYCIVNPASIISMLGWIVGILMVISAAGKIGNWRERNALGFAENYELISAIISLVVGILLMVSNAFKFAISTAIIYILAAWLAVLGVFRILGARNLKQMNVDPTMHLLNYHAQMRSGIVLLVAAAVIFLCPMLVTSAIGFIVGFCLLAFGIRQITIALQM